MGVSSAIVYALCTARQLRHSRVGLGRGKIVIAEEAVAEEILNLVQGTGLLQAAQAGEDGIEEIEQAQTGVLIEEQLPITGAIALRADVAESLQKGSQHPEILEALEFAGTHFAPTLLSHDALNARTCRNSRKNG
jgi:hypothetical protein